MKMFNLKVAQPLTEVLVIAVPHWGRNKHVLFDAWLGEVLPLGFQKEVLFFPPHILPPFPGMLPNWLCSLFYLLQLFQGESKKREGRGSFLGQYILAFHCSSYTPGSPLNVKLLYWLPSFQALPNFFGALLPSGLPNLCVRTELRKKWYEGYISTFQR